MEEPRKHSKEFFYTDENDVPRDAALHETLLDNPEANAASRAAAIRAAIGAGMKPEDAEKFFEEDGRTAQQATFSS